MLLVVFLLVCLVLVSSLCLLFWFRLRRIHKQIMSVAVLLDGKPDSSISDSEICEKINREYKKLEDGLGLFFENGKKSERISVRLSGNIQKALQYTAAISRDTSVNRQIADDLYILVSEGSAAVEEILASISSLKSQVEIQNSSVSQTSESINEMNAAIKLVSEIASERLADTHSLVRETDVGSDKLTETDRVIRSVQDSADEILSLTTVIDEIASKTNLLSMNAAIEAAHAGEAGKGFAVVAEEIRTLAESTSENAASISETLNSLVSRIESAGELSRQSGEAFINIESGVRQVADAFTRINEETNHLTQNADSVVESTGALKQISEQTTSSMEEMETGAVDINSTLESSKQIADDLNRAMSRLVEESSAQNLVTTKISKSYLNSARGLVDMLNIAGKLEEEKSFGVSEFETIRKKLHYTNVILSHINWVAVVRAVIDGARDFDLDILEDSSRCSSGIWLKKSAGDIIGDAGKKDLLVSRHEELHNLFKQIRKKMDSGDIKPVESLYQDLIQISGEIVQILTTEGYKDFIVWDSGLSVEVDLFDRHHQKLISIINQLYKYMEEGKGNEILLKTLDDLLEYTDYHFSSEEKAFDKYSYPDAEAHKKQHKELLTQAGSLAADLKAGRAVLSNEVLDFLQDWVTNHIMKSDKAYSEFMKGRDLRGIG